MGFKLAALTAPKGDQSLTDFAIQMLGRPVDLQDTDLTTENILLEADCYACSIDNQHWLFDWSLIGDWLETPPSFGKPCAAFMLQSTVNAYGFSISDGKHILRKRIGDEGNIKVDEGPLLHAEQTMLASFGEVGEAFAAWSNAEKSFDGEWEGITHDVMGEDIVFSVMRDTLGFSLDQESDQLRRFESAPVQKIGNRKSFLSRIFGKQ